MRWTHFSQIVDQAQVVLIELSRAELHHCCQLAVQTLVFNGQLSLRCATLVTFEVSPNIYLGSDILLLI